MLPAAEDLNFELARNVVRNNRQQSVYTTVMDALHNGKLRDRCFFVDGREGSGMTTVYKKIYADLWQANTPFICVASTDIASA